MGTPRQRPRPKLLLSLRTHIVQPSLPALHASDSRPGRRASGLGRERINTGRSRQLLGSFCAGVAQPEAVRGNLPEARRWRWRRVKSLRLHSCWYEEVVLKSVFIGFQTSAKSLFNLFRYLKVTVTSRQQYQHNTSMSI